jgi:hypothetical protein
METFAEGGLVGISLLGMLLLSLLRFHLRHRAAVPSAALIALVAQLIFCQSSGDMFDSRGLFLLGGISTMSFDPRFVRQILRRGKHPALSRPPVEAIARPRLAALPRRPRVA